MTAEKLVRLADKIYAARAACRAMPSWDEKIPQIKQLIQKRADRKKIEILSAMIQLMNLCIDDSVAMMWLMAGAAEILEPSEQIAAVPARPESEALKGHNARIQRPGAAGGNDGN